MSFTWLSRKVFYVVLQEGPPTLRRRSSVSHQILTHRRFADFNSEFQQLAMDLRRTPEWVLATHSPDELAYVLRHGRSSTSTMATLPSPEQTKSLPLPANDGICLQDHQHSPPFRPTPGEQSPKPTICGTQSWSFHRSLQNIELMTKSQDFNLECGTAYDTSQRGR
jgi:hypothetical protein